MHRIYTKEYTANYVRIYSKRGSAHILCIYIRQNIHALARETYIYA
jgi:hypothetical protein